MHHYTCHECSAAGREPGHSEMVEYEGARPECPVCDAPLEYDGEFDDKTETSAKGGETG